MPLEIQQQILLWTSILLVPFLMAMFLWSRRMRESSGWALLEQRYPQKDRFNGDWQINRRLRLDAIKGYHTVDIGYDAGYLYLRPTQHGDILKRTLQIPWSAIVSASTAESLVELSVTEDRRVVLGLNCSGLLQIEQIKPLLVRKTEETE
ncbi:MAG: hypothetical protein AB7W16_14525 [Candidatus Obscuribacterales bacterium]